MNTPYYFYENSTPQENYPFRRPSFYNSYQPLNHVLRNSIEIPIKKEKSPSTDDFLQHEQRLNENLFQHGFRRMPVRGDGNCLFYALALGLLYKMHQKPNSFAIEIRHALNVPSNVRLTEFADRLRKLCVDQWRQHENYYSQFVDRDEVNFLREVRKFSKNGVSESILGDIVPLTIANAFDIRIQIFTSLENLPMIEVKTERRTSSNTKPTIYLAYNQFASGHYDAAYPF